MIEAYQDTSLDEGLNPAPNLAQDFAGKNPLSDLVEEFVECHNRLAPDLDRYEALKKQLAGIAALDKSDLPVTLVGYTHVIDYTAPAESLVLVVTPEDYHVATGDWSALSVSITAAKRLLSPHQLSVFFEKKSGSRRFRRIR